MSRIGTLFCKKAVSVKGRSVATLMRPLISSAEQRFKNSGGRKLLKGIPVVINNYNRLSYVRSLVERLLEYGLTNIWIIDNGSTLPALLEYYQKSAAGVLYSGRNVGPFSLWQTRAYWKFCRSYYVYTDPDVMPVVECPRDFLEYFYDVLCAQPTVMKVGFGLRIDDLPAHYPNKEKVVRWESQFWEQPVGPELYSAPIDTTFALYRPWAHWYHGRASIRTGPPYVAQHLPWYVDSRVTSDEDRYYENSIRKGASWWVGKDPLSSSL